MKLFTKTCAKDLQWLELAFVSVLRNSTESVEWTVVCDNGEKSAVTDLFSRAKAFVQHRQMNDLFQCFEIHERWPEASSMGSGYIQQQWVKMTAHRVMGNDYFLNWDSDVIALRSICSFNFKNALGKPILWFTPFNDLIQGGDEAVHRARQDWIKKIFQIQEAPFEWMRCMPLWMNGEILRISESRPEWSRTADLMRANSTHGMSEFNIIGQLSNTFFPDAYDYKNTQNSSPTWSGPSDSKTAFVSQAWSWGEIPEQFKQVALGL